MTTKGLTMRSIGLALLLVAGLAAPAAAQKIEVRVQRDKSFSFQGLKTWNWHPDGAGDVKLMSSSLDDPKPIKARLEPMVIAAVERELAARGLVKRTDGPTDLIVNYYILVMPATTSQQMGQFLPAVAEYGLPPFQGATTALKAFEQGSLVLDIVAPKEKSVIWRGIAETEVQREYTTEQRQVRLNKAVHEIVKKLPKK